MNREEVRRIACEAFDCLVRDVEAGRSESLREYRRAMGRFRNYSLGNTILIHSQRAGATYVVGFRTWKRLGRCVESVPWLSQVERPFAPRALGQQSPRKAKAAKGARDDLVSLAPQFHLVRQGAKALSGLGHYPGPTLRTDFRHRLLQPELPALP